VAAPAAVVTSDVAAPPLAAASDDAAPPLAAASDDAAPPLAAASDDAAPPPPAADAPVLAASPSPSPGRRPIELRRIKGIGPKFAQALAAAGIVDAAVIADWSEADVARAASLVGVRPERIERDDWVGQARALRDAV
jgi:NADH-quinone oxidoreductase subunit E